MADFSCIFDVFGLVTLIKLSQIDDESTLGPFMLHIDKTIHFKAMTLGAPVCPCAPLKRFQQKKGKKVSLFNIHMSRISVICVRF